MNENAVHAASGGVKIKFCGFTRREDAETATSLGVDALGFNFYPKSKRGLPLPAAFDWIGNLSRGPLFIAVLVNPSRAELVEIIASGIFDMIQFHGDEEPGFCAECELPWIKAVPSPLPASFAHKISEFQTCDWLLDAAAPPGQYGGTGNIADWHHAAKFVQAHRGEMIWLAGGLSALNVRSAIDSVQPTGVDVAGGIESSPGIKSPQKMKEFVEAVRKTRDFV
jgi:phosphoribosylanthranilate isomerase